MVAQLLTDFYGWRTLAVFKRAGSEPRFSLSRWPIPNHPLFVPGVLHARKTRTLHKNCEECATRKSTPPCPGQPAVRKRHTGHNLDGAENPGED
jgi:hypothetical protein